MLYSAVMPSLAARIRFVRKTILNVTQTELARRIGVSRGAVGNWELGGAASPRHLTAIADLSGATLDWLVNGRGDPPAILERWEPSIEEAIAITVQLMVAVARLRWSKRETFLAAEMIREFYERKQFAHGARDRALRALEAHIRQALSIENLKT